MPRPLEQPTAGEPADDGRLYIPDYASGWHVRLKADSEMQYCHARLPGQDYFHSFMTGEIFVEKNGEHYCLMCARRLGIVSTDRLFWQRHGPGVDIPAR
jgi:hypothetical protein